MTEKPDVDFLPYIKGNNLTVRIHLEKEFGGFQKCDGNNVSAPPENQKIEITTPLQTCHETSGYHLDENQCIPIGVYTVGKIDSSNSMMYSIWLDREDGEKVFAIIGHPAFPNKIKQTSIDWCGCRKIS